MRAVMIIIGILLGLLAGGFYYHLFDDIITDFFLGYVYDTNNIYYVGSRLVWDSIPYVLLFISILFFAIGGQSKEVKG